MKYEKHLLIDIIKFYAVVALILTVGLARYVEPNYWIGIYPVVLVALLGVSLMINYLLEWMGWPKGPVVRKQRRVRVATRKKKK